MRIFVLDASGPDASAEQTFVTQLLRDFSLRDLMSVTARRKRFIAVERLQVNEMRSSLVLCLLFASQILVGATASGVIVDDVRVQALSSTLLRIEPRGPMGVFESNATFNIVGREGFGGDGTIALAIHRRPGSSSKCNCVTSKSSIQIAASARMGLFVSNCSLSSY